MNKDEEFDLDTELFNEWLYEDQECPDRPDPMTISKDERECLI